MTGAIGAQGMQGVAGTNGLPGTTGSQGPIGLTGAEGTTGQNSTTYFNTGAITINNSSNSYYATGFPLTITVPANCKTLISADIGIQFTSNNNTTVADVFLIVDGATTANGAYYRAAGSNAYGNGNLDSWEKVNFTQALNLSAGTHTIGIAGYLALGPAFTFGGDGNSVLQGELTVTFIKY